MSIPIAMELNRLRIKSWIRSSLLQGSAAGEDVLVDYGCGKARSTIVLATQPLKKAIGIEMAGQLCDIARDNVELASSKLNTPDVEILQADATKYDVPEDANIIYLYNSFGGQILDAVLTKIQESVQKAPRKLKFFYLFPDLESNRLEACDWLQRTGELPTGRMTWLTLHVYENTV